MMTSWRALLALMLMVVAAVSCSGHDYQSDPELETVREALTPTGPVPTQTMATGFAAGTMTGGFSVTADGQASYQIPIWAPTGIMGIQPSLSLAYNSAVGSGNVGVGWSLAGFPISQITRCPRTLAVDGVAGPVDFQGDTYCLDGKRLLPVSSTDYRTERDEFTKIVRAGTTTAPTSFTAYLKNGWILTYGGGTNSRLGGNRKVYIPNTSTGGADVGTETVNYAWALDTVKDRANAISGVVANQMKIFYTTSSSPTPTHRYSANFTFKEFVIDSIDYAFGASGSTAHRWLRFIYGGTRNDASYRFVSGFGVMSTKLLTRIEAHGPNPTLTGLVKRYELFYETAPVSGRSRVSSVQECDGAAAKVCKTPTRFEYEPGSNQFVEYTDPQVPNALSASPFSVADVNGDGKQDVIYRTFDPSSPATANFYYRLSQLGANTAQGVPNAAPLGPPVQIADLFANSSQYVGSLEPFDLDADGRSDLAVLWSFAGTPPPPPVGTTGSRRLLRFNGAFGYQTDPYPPTGQAPSTEYPYLLATPLYVGDMDGDGLPETVEMGPGPHVWDSGPTRVFRRLLLRKNQVGANQSPSLGSRSDISTGTGSSLTNYTMATRPNLYNFAPGSAYAVSGYNAFMADIDGSGRQALMVEDSSYRPSVTPNVNTNSVFMRAFYALPNGSGVETKLTTLRASPRPPSGSRYIMIDVNADGLMDAFEVVNNTGTSMAMPPTTQEDTLAAFRINTGAGFAGAFTGTLLDIDPKFRVNTREDGGVEVADMNQDGLPDIVLMGQAAAGGVTHRTTIQVLKAQSGINGPAQKPHFVAGESPKIGTSEIPAVLPVFGTIGGMPARVGDFNGDGLPDIMAIPVGDTSKRFHIYIHQGKKADLLNKVIDGLGAQVTINQASIADPAVYKRGRFGVTVPGTDDEATWEPNADCRYPLSCSTGGMWVVGSYSLSDDHGSSGSNQYSFEYAEGRTDALRGWLGFAQRIQTDPNMGKTVTTFENWVRVGKSYPYAFLPKLHGRVGKDTLSGCDPCVGQRTQTTNTYGYVESAALNGAKIFRTRLANSATDVHVSPGAFGGEGSDFVSWFFALPTGWIPFSSENVATSAFTAYDDPVDTQVTLPSELIAAHHDYFADDTASWLVGRVRQTSVTSAAAGKTATRATSVTYQSGTKWPATVTIEPNGGTDVKSVTTFSRSTAGLGQVTSTSVAATAQPDDPLAGTALTRTTSTTYDTVDGVYPTATTAANLTTTYAYHGGLGVPAQIADVNGIVTTYTFDGFGRQRSESTPQQGNITFDYLAHAGMAPSTPATTVAVYNAQAPAYTIQRSEGGAGTSLVTYNQRGDEVLRRWTGGDGQFVQVLTTYTNLIGQVNSTSLPFRATGAYQQTSFVYDNFNQLIRKSLPGGAEYRYTYSFPQNYAQRVLSQDPRQQYTVAVYDDRGRTVSSTERAIDLQDVTTTYEYGPFGNLGKVTLPSVTSASGTLNGTTTLTYDARGRRIDLFDADAGNSKRSYNAFGEVVRERDANNKTTLFYRDSLGRVVQTTNNGDSSFNLYAWDGPMGKGKLRETNSFDGVKKAYTYDSFGRLDTKTWTIQGKTYQYKNTYDSFSRVAGLSYPSMGAQPFQIEYGFDQAGQVDAVHRVGDGSTYWHALHRVDDGRVDEEEFGSGFKTKRVFHAQRRWTDSIRTYKTSAVDVQNVIYGHDLGGNVNARQDLVHNTTETFVPSPNDALSQWVWNSPSYTTTYNPNPNGTMSGHVGSPGLLSYTYDYYWNGADPSTGDPTRTGGMHAIQRTTGALQRQMLYDAAGRQTTTFSGQFVAYNSFDLPKQIGGDPSGGGVVFTYDAEGARATKAGAPSPQPSATTYAGRFYEKRVMPTGETQHVFHIPANGRIVAQDTWIEKPAGVFARANVLYLHDDIVGSIVGVTSTAGSTSALRYDPYGLRINQTNPGIPPSSSVTSFFHAGTSSFYTMNLGFTGHEMDDDVGCINMKGRVYDPKLGRFLTPDPFMARPFKPAAWDRYAYVGNEPLRYTDPSGFMGIGGYTSDWLNQQGYDTGMSGIVSGMTRGEVPGRERAAGGPGGNPAPSPSPAPPTPDGPFTVDYTQQGNTTENGPWSNEPFTGSLLMGVSTESKAGGKGGGYDDGGSRGSSGEGASGRSPSPRPDPSLAGMPLVLPIVVVAGTALAGGYILWWGQQPATQKVGQDLLTRIKHWWNAEGTPEYKVPKTGTGKEKADDVPDWARGNRPRVGEAGKKFAERLMDEKYGKGNYPRGPGTEFGKIQKWGDRGFQDP